MTHNKKNKFKFKVLYCQAVVELCPTQPLLVFSFYQKCLGWPFREVFCCCSTFIYCYNSYQWNFEVQKNHQSQEGGGGQNLLWTFPNFWSFLIWKASPVQSKQFTLVSGPSPVYNSYQLFSEGFLIKSRRNTCWNS